MVALGEKIGKALATNAVYGNLGVAFAALLTGAIAQWLGWRAAFVVPGLVSIVIGVAFVLQVPGELPAGNKGGAVR